MLLLLKILLISLGLILALGIGSLWLIRRQIQDDSIPIQEVFTQEKVMFIFPHPDDEITCAGLLKKLDREGVETILITLTHGEAGPTNGLVQEDDPIQKKNKLGEIRQQELETVAQLLGIDYLEILDYSDGRIKEIPSEILKQVLLEKIETYQPTILITYDDKIGLYGHPDHIQIARYLQEIYLERRNLDNFPIKSLYQVTLPEPMLKTALKISDNFRKNYPTLAENGLPKPDIAVKITPYGIYKRKALEAHLSQQEILRDMLPYFDKFPPAIYFRIFDKEYFAKVQ